MSRWLSRALLAVVLGLGVLAGLIRAEQPAPLPMPNPTTPQVIPQIGPGNPVVSPSPDVLTPEIEPAAPAPSRRHLLPRGHLVRDWWHNHAWTCWAPPEYPGCSSLKSECNFIFGSCRSFYGEPCLREPPKNHGLPSNGNSPSDCGCR
jgi:hypothetical protein